MIEVTKLKALDYEEMLAKGGRAFTSELNAAQARVLEASPHAYSIFIDGKLRFVGGVAEYWTGRGEAWAILDPECKKDFLALHGTVKRFFKICPVRRIEASIDVDFEPGHRWVKALGFKLEAERLEGFLPDGRAASLYAMVRH